MSHIRGIFNFQGTIVTAGQIIVFDRYPTLVFGAFAAYSDRFARVSINPILSDGWTIRLIYEYAAMGVFEYVIVFNNAASILG